MMVVKVFGTCDLRMGGGILYGGGGDCCVGRWGYHVFLNSGTRTFNSWTRSRLRKVLIGVGFGGVGNQVAKDVG